jgi:hypothetical protein
MQLASGLRTSSEDFCGRIRAEKSIDLIALLGAGLSISANIMEYGPEIYPLFELEMHGHLFQSKLIAVSVSAKVETLSEGAPRTLKICGWCQPVSDSCVEVPFWWETHTKPDSLLCHKQLAQLQSPG